MAGSKLLMKFGAFLVLGPMTPLRSEITPYLDSVSQAELMTSGASDPLLGSPCISTQLAELSRSWFGTADPPPLGGTSSRLSWGNPLPHPTPPP